MGRLPARPPSRLRGRRVYGSGSPALGSRWRLRALRWGPGVGGCGGYPRDTWWGPGRYLCACPAACPREARAGLVGVTPQLGFGERDREMWGTVLWEDWGAVLGDLGYGTMQCGVQGWEVWGAVAATGQQEETQGSKGRSGVSSAWSAASLAPQSSQFNQQGPSKVPSCGGPGQGPMAPPPQPTPTGGSSAGG